MKKIVNVTGWRVTSEPGDGTRYDYFVHRNGPVFSFAPRVSTFRFPDQINYWDVWKLDDWTSRGVLELAKVYQCNAYTLLECIRTMKELWEEAK